MGLLKYSIPQDCIEVIYICGGIAADWTNTGNNTAENDMVL